MDDQWSNYNRAVIIIIVIAILINVKFLFLKAQNNTTSKVISKATISI